jgi:hypothetical protein
MAITYQILSITGDCSNNGSGSINLLAAGGTAPYNISWTEPNLGTDTNTTTSERGGLYAGTYSLRITDSSIPFNNELFVNIPISNGNCCNILGVGNSTCGLNNGFVSGSSSNAFSQQYFYLYTSNGTLLNSQTTTSNLAVFGNLSAGTYYLVAQDYGGCTGTSETFVIEETYPFDYGLYVVPNSACGNVPLGKIFVTGTTGVPPYTYGWSNGATGSTITGLTAGSYGVSVTDSLGCNVIKTGVVTNVEPVTIYNFTVVSPTCLTNNASITVYVTGGTVPFYYSASTGYQEISYARQLTLSGLAGGFIAISVKDAALCETSISTTIQNPTGISNVTVETTNSSCATIDGSITAVVQGGVLPLTYTLTYPTSNTKTTTTNLRSNLFSELSGGTYDLNVTDSSGCTFIASYYVDSQNQYTLSTTSTGTTLGLKNGVINATISSGGTPPYNYSLDNGTVDILQTTLTAVTFYDVAEGQHSVSVVDANGCRQVSAASVSTTPQVNFTLLPTSAKNPSGGTITALVTSGVPPYTFNWSSNVSGNPQSIKVENLTAGTYSLTLVDSNGSYAERSTTVNGSSLISSYKKYTVSNEPFSLNTSAKYSMLKMLNEGFFDLTSGNTGCQLVSATFSARLVVQPYGTQVIEPFYVANSLVTPPNDNVWYDTIKSMILKVRGVGDVIIDELNNKLLIISDVDNQQIVDGTITAINIKVYLMIDYVINCNG